MTIRAVCAALTVLVLGAGCTKSLDEILRPAEVQETETVKSEEIDSDGLLEYYAYISGLGGDPLLREYRRAQRVFVDDPTDGNRMQLVMLLSSQDAPFRNTKAATVLLRTWLDDESNSASEMRPLATLFDDYITEVERLDTAVAQQSEKLGETSERIASQAQKLNAEKKWSAQLQKKLDGEKARTTALQEKLDALLEMEMNLIERDQLTNPEPE